ncbi:exocyst complex component EXO70A1-like [Olea europaea subsp. europaea]|uniref:Exocyst subunit Exo70 family protein n=1 Tax=Olea europaea subsp. europaea TaxID=158383 RepID=A0A8S0TH12_OLEEU|nr:exocyst complex component EXO70A1-like [Olea europaea subsp. europaea]
MNSTISYQLAVDTIYHWHHRSVEQLIFDHGEREITRYLEAVDRIQQSPGNGTESGDLNSLAMVRLKHEFLTVLTTKSDQIGTFDSVTSDWSSLASTGNEDYFSADSSLSDELQKIVYRGDAKSAFKKKRFLWEELKVKIELWIRVARKCICIFIDEKQISEILFSGFGNGASEECYWEIVGDSANNLLVFAEIVSSSNQSPERMGTILGLYDTLLFLLQYTDTLFDIDAAEPIREGMKGKSKKLNHVPLRHLFMMNNVHYIVEKIEESKELREIIGDDYMEKLNTNVMQAMTSYQVSTCDKFLSSCREEGIHVTWCFSTQVSKRTLRKRLKAINSMIEEI